MAYTTTWVGSPWYTPGRPGKVRRIVLHWMATNLAGADATFGPNSTRKVSAHYGLEDAKRHQYVKESDTAWHAGVRTVNQDSIGIEHSAQPGRPASEATIANSIDFITSLCRDYGLTADDIHVHSEFYATQCPGTLPVARIRAAVAANLAGTAQEDDPMADITLTNPATKELVSVTTGLNSTWAYAWLNYGLLVALGKKVGVDVDEAALAQSLLAGLSPVVKDAVTAAAAAGGTPDQIADAVVAKLGAALTKEA